MSSRSKTTWILALAVILLFAGSHLAQSYLDQPAVGPSDTSTPQRIISLAPSVTEVLFALGLDDRVVGVTRFCQYPAEAVGKPRVGGYFDPNYEAILALKPDMVFTLTGKEENRPAFEKMGLRCVALCHLNVEGILDSIEQIGRICDVAEAADRLLADLRGRMRQIERRTAGLRRPRVLFAIDRPRGSGRLDDVYIAGSDGHVDRMIAMAGGQNAYRGPIRFPIVSAEGILGLNPEVLIDMVPSLADDPSVAAAAAKDWRQLPQVDAVAHDRVHVLNENFISVPGPRFILVVEKLARLIHPEVEWD